MSSFLAFLPSSWYPIISIVSWLVTFDTCMSQWMHEYTLTWMDEGLDAHVQLRNKGLVCAFVTGGRMYAYIYFTCRHIRTHM